MRRSLVVFTNPAADINESKDSLEIIFISQMSFERLASRFKGDGHLVT